MYFSHDEENDQEVKNPLEKHAGNSDAKGGLFILEYDQTISHEPQERDWTLWSYRELAQKRIAETGLANLETSPPQGSIVNKVLRVVVTDVHGGCKFYVHIVGDENIQGQLDSMEIEEAPEIGSYIPKRGDLVLAQSRMDHSWKRAIIAHERPDASGWFEVIFVDHKYGENAYVPYNCLRPPSPAVHSAFGVAQLCSLAFIKVPCLEEEYGQEAVQCFKKETIGYVHQMTVVVKEDDISDGNAGQGIWTVVLNLSSRVFDADGETINDLLLTRGLARLEKANRWDTREMKSEIRNMVWAEEEGRLFETMSVKFRTRIKLIKYGDESETSALANKIQRLGYSASMITDWLEKNKMYEFCTLFPEYYEFKRNIIAQLLRIAAEFSADDELMGCFVDTLKVEGYIQHATTYFPSGESTYKVDVQKLKSRTSMECPLYRSVSNCGFLKEAHEGLEYLFLEHIDETSFDQIKKFKYLQVLFFVGIAGNEMIQPTNGMSMTCVKLPHDIFLNLKHLKVLGLRGVPIDELPSSIGEAKELRYLDLSNSLIERLPETIGLLDKLQTLRLEGCLQLRRLPQGITKLSALEHLDFDVLTQLSFLPRYMGKLTKLKTLQAFIVGKDDGRRISELKSMDLLEGRICILQLENVSNADLKEAKRCLYWMKNLKTLELRWSMSRIKDTKGQDEDYTILNQLEPPVNLEHLQVSGYRGSKYPQYWSDHYKPSLASFTLLSCNLEEFPQLEKYQRLRVIQLIDITAMREIKLNIEKDNVDVAAFPALEELLIVNMSSLEKLTGGKGDFPRLCNLTIEQCPKLKAIDELLAYTVSLKKLELRSCTELSSLISDQEQLPASLDCLNIQTCPHLQKRYRKDGEDWDKIRHVRTVYIDDDNDDDDDDCDELI